MKIKHLYSCSVQKLFCVFFIFAFLCVSSNSFADNRNPSGNHDLVCKPPVKKTKKHQENTNSLVFIKKLSEFADEMSEHHGFDKSNLECVFSYIRHNETVRKLVKPAPAGQPKNWQAYRARFIEPVRITAGAAFWSQYRTALEKAHKEYGIPPEIIVGIIGIETTFGQNKGYFRILDALATLAFDYPEHPKREARMALFKNEFRNILLLAREHGLDLLSIHGSYAGAIGWPQFLPSSIREYAVDFDGDGKIDLLNSPVDAIGSVANFLARHGWRSGDPTVFPAEHDKDCNISIEIALNQGLEAKLTEEELSRYCVTTKMQLPENMFFGVIDLQNGLEPTEYWLATNNFFAITHYNRSYFYAMAVITLGRSIQAFQNENISN